MPKNTTLLAPSAVSRESSDGPTTAAAAYAPRAAAAAAPAASSCRQDWRFTDEKLCPFDLFDEFESDTWWDALRLEWPWIWESENADKDGRMEPRVSILADGHSPLVRVVRRALANAYDRLKSADDEAAVALQTARDLKTDVVDHRPVPDAVVALATAALDAMKTGDDLDAFLHVHSYSAAAYRSVTDEAESKDDGAESRARQSVAQTKPSELAANLELLVATQSNTYADDALSTLHVRLITGHPALFPKLRGLVLNRSKATVHLAPMLRAFPTLSVSFLTEHVGLYGVVCLLATLAPDVYQYWHDIQPVPFLKHVQSAFSSATIIKDLSKHAKETAAKETAAKETAAKETAAKETAAKETAAKETAVKETAVKETAVKETAAVGHGGVIGSGHNFQLVMSKASCKKALCDDTLALLCHLPGRVRIALTTCTGTGHQKWLHALGNLAKSPPKCCDSVHAHKQFDLALRPPPTKGSRSPLCVSLLF
jgi:hypothetical protein